MILKNALPVYQPTKQNSRTSWDAGLGSDTYFLESWGEQVFVRLDWGKRYSYVTTVREAFDENMYTQYTLVAQRETY